MRLPRRSIERGGNKTYNAEDRLERDTRVCIYCVTADAAAAVAAAAARYAPSRAAFCSAVRVLMHAWNRSGLPSICFTIESIRSASGCGTVTASR